MIKSVKRWLSVAVVVTALLACTGAVAAADTVDFTSGSATLAIGPVTIVDNDKMQVHIALTDLKTNADGSTITVDIEGLHDVLQDLKLKSFTVKLSSSGIDNAGSSLAVSTGLIPVTLGDFTKMANGMTITESTSFGPFKLLEMINQLSSVSLEIKPSATTASVSLDITANVDTGTSVSPNIKLSGVRVSKLTGNPSIAISLSSGGNQISKSYLLDAGKGSPSETAVPTATATATPTATVTETVTPTVTATAAPTQMDYLPVPTISSATSAPVTTYQSPAPILGILAGCACAAGFLILGRRNRH